MDHVRARGPGAHRRRDRRTRQRPGGEPAAAAPCPPSSSRSSRDRLSSSRRSAGTAWVVARAKSFRHHRSTSTARNAVPTRKALCFVDSDGERTITTLGPRLEARGSDGLAWDHLDDAGAVYVTAGDADALRRARVAKVMVVSTRHLAVLAASGVRADAVVGSASDVHERYDPEVLAHAPPDLVVRTEGAEGGSFDCVGRRATSLRTSPVPRPDHRHVRSRRFVPRRTHVRFGSRSRGDRGAAAGRPVRCGRPRRPRPDGRATRPPRTSDRQASSSAERAQSSRSSSRNAWTPALVLGPSAIVFPGRVRRTCSSSRRVNSQVDVLGSMP